MLYALLAIPVLGVLILAHEWGHFAAARCMRVRVLEFGIGFPPRLLSLGQRNGVTYTLNWIPIGGFVRLAGEEDAGVEGGLAAKKPAQRALVLVAGALMNLLLALLVFTGLALAPQERSTLQRIGIVGIIPGGPAEQAGLQGGDILLTVNGRPIKDEKALLEFALNGGRATRLEIERAGQVLTRTIYPSVEPVHGADHLGVDLYLPQAPEAALSQVLPDRPAYRDGLRPGDVVVALDGHVVRDNLDFWETLHHRRQEGRPLVFLVRRDGVLLDEITVQPPPPEDENQALGIGWWTEKEVVRLSVPAALLQGAGDTAEAILLVPRVLGAIFRGSVPLRSLAGPIGIVQATAEVAQASQVEGVLRLVGLLSANLFVVNLLPLPALDGGRLIFVLLEWLRGGRRIPHRWETRIHQIGLALLLALLVLVTIFDILRLVAPP